MTTPQSRILPQWFSRRCQPKIPCSVKGGGGYPARYLQPSQHDVIKTVCSRLLCYGGITCCRHALWSAGFCFVITTSEAQIRHHNAHCLHGNIYDNDNGSLTDPLWQFKLYCVSSYINDYYLYIWTVCHTYDMLLFNNNFKERFYVEWNR